MKTTPARRLRLLFVTSGLARGGAEVFLTRLLPRLADRGHTCAVASLGQATSLGGPLAEAGIETVSLGSGVLRPGMGAARMARRFHPDVIQGWMYRGNLGALVAGSTSPARPPVVWSIRQGLNDLNVSPWTTRASVWVGARLSGRPVAIVYNADSARRQHEALGFAAGGSRVIPNGIDVSNAPLAAGLRAAARARLGLPVDAFVVALVARWHPVKNHRGFARAAGRFAARHPEARFLLAGAGVEAGNARLASWLREEKLTQRVVLLGECSDIAGVHAAADVATLSSHGEALPNALLEAMASNLPCVAPDVGDIAALIGPTGVVVSADDDQALAAGWEHLAAMSANERDALGRLARARVADSYGLDRSVSAFEALYLESTAGRLTVSGR